jgi:hypothetical protein
MDHNPSPSPNGDGGAPPQPPQAEDTGAKSSEHLNIKVTDGNNEVFFKIKKSTPLKKLMDAFCDRQGKSANSVRFLFDGIRLNPTDTPEDVSLPRSYAHHFGGGSSQHSCAT